MGLGFGIFAGLLMDMGYGPVVGFYAIMLGLLGFFIGLLAVNLVKPTCSPPALHRRGGVYGDFLTFCVFLYTPGLRYGGPRLPKYYLPMMLYSFLPTPILYYFNKAFVVGVREVRKPFDLTRERSAHGREQ